NAAKSPERKSPGCWGRGYSTTASSLVRTRQPEQTFGLHPLERVWTRTPAPARHDQSRYFQSSAERNRFCRSRAPLGCCRQSHSARADNRAAPVSIEPKAVVACSAGGVRL